MAKKKKYTLKELAHAFDVLNENAEDDYDYYKVDEVAYAIASLALKRKLECTADSGGLASCMKRVKEIEEQKEEEEEEENI